MAARVGGAVLTPEEVLSLPEQGLLEPERLAVPVVGRRGRLAVLALAEREVRGGTAPFGHTDAETLCLYASQAAVALENATLHREALEQERLERELELAATIQRQLLPTSIPTPPGFDIAAKSEPSRRVGGDVYDFIETPQGLFLMLGDVAGKGVPAALMAASLQAAVRILVQRSPELSELTSLLHQHILASTPESKFATVFLAYLRSNGELEWVSAGHNPVVLVSPGGTIELPEGGGAAARPAARTLSTHLRRPSWSRGRCCWPTPTACRRLPAQGTTDRTSAWRASRRSRRRATRGRWRTWWPGCLRP